MALRKTRAGEDPNTRLCTKCKRYLPITMFHVDNSRYDGLTTWCRECRTSAVQKWSDDNPDMVKHRLRRWRKANPDKVRAQNQRAYLKLRKSILNHYGDKCACCGETAIEFLSIDHINGCGEKQRQEVGSGGKFYQWLKDNGYPDGFRILCHNCNMAIGFYGYCPHQKQGTSML